MFVNAILVRMYFNKKYLDKDSIDDMDPSKLFTMRKECIRAIDDGAF